MDLGTTIGLIVVLAVLIIGAEMTFGKTRRRRSAGDGGSGDTNDGGSDGGGDGGGGD